MFPEGREKLAEINNMSVPVTRGVINSYNMPQLSRSSVSPSEQNSPSLCSSTLYLAIALEARAIHTERSHFGCREAKIEMGIN